MDTSVFLYTFFGGCMIGLAAALLLFFNGRIAGISGIAAGLLSPRSGEFGWRLAFIGGMLLAGLIMPLLIPDPVSVEVNASLPVIIVGGFLVGLGTRIGGGCTSGHGVCGIARFSKRSIAATLIFIASAMVTVFVTRHVLQGGAV